ncbi:MAG: PEP-CTERM sorting domain-containing protein [Planctomycetota bacterium]
MHRSKLLRRGTAPALALAGLAYAGPAAAVNLDFETDAFGNPMVNGQVVDPFFDSGFDEFSTGPVQISTRYEGARGRAFKGATIFDSDMTFDDEDQDLLVGLGNILILQNSELDDSITLANGSLAYTDANDEGKAGRVGSFVFSFTDPVTLNSIDLIDLDEGAGATLSLTDAFGGTFFYDVPIGWTNDIFTDGGVGFSTLSFETTDPQVGETGLFATSRFGSAGAGQNGFAFDAVTELEVLFIGNSPSGGLDNLRFDEGQPIPEPASLAVAALGGAMLMARRRRG